MEKYTFKQIQEKYQLGKYPSTTVRMIKYAEACGLKIALFENKKTNPQYFNIIDDTIMRYH